MEQRRTILPPSQRPGTLPINHRSLTRTSVPEKIMLKRGMLTAPVKPLHGHSGILILQSDDPLTYAKGMLLVSNAELGRRTNGKTTHATYESILDLDRAFRHMRIKSGMSHHHVWGEFQLLDQDEATCRAAISVLLDSGILPLELEQTLRSQIDHVVHDLQFKRNELKLIARRQLARGKNVNDRRGRRNPGAAKAAATAGLENFGKRRTEIMRIMSFMDLRGQEVTAEIIRIRRIYENLYEFLKPLPTGPVRVETRVAHTRLAWLIRNAQRDLVIARLLAFDIMLKTITVLPFSRNAAHCLHDLDEVMTAYGNGDIDTTVKRITQLRRGVSWISILFRLEEPLAKTAFLIGWLDQNASARRRNMPDVITVEEERAELIRRHAEIRRLIGDVVTRIRQASDEGLNQSVKALVLALVDEASEMGETMLVKIHVRLSDAIALL